MLPLSRRFSDASCTAGAQRPKISKVGRSPSGPPVTRRRATSLGGGRVSAGAGVVEAAEGLRWSSPSDSTYDVVSRVSLVEADVWIMDIGISVFNEEPPPAGLAVGEVVAGEIYVGVDPF